METGEEQHKTSPFLCTLTDSLGVLSVQQTPIVSYQSYIV